LHFALYLELPFSKRMFIPSLILSYANKLELHVLLQGRMNSSTYNSGYAQGYNSTDYSQGVQGGEYEYDDTATSNQTGYGYPSTTSSYEYASNPYTPESVMPTYEYTYSGYGRYDASDSTSRTEYPSNQPVSAFGALNSGSYGYTQPVSSAPSAPAEDLRDINAGTAYGQPSSSGHRRGDQRHHRSSSSTDKHSKHMRTSHKSRGPPSSLTSVFVANPESEGKKKPKRSYSDEEKLKVERVRSMGACGPCRQNKRTVSFLHIPSQFDHTDAKKTVRYRKAMSKMRQQSWRQHRVC